MTLRTLYTLYAPHSTLHSTDDTAHSIYNLHSTHYTLHSTSLYALLYTSHLTLDTPLYTTLHTLNFTLDTLHYILHSTLYTPHTKLHTLHLTPHTLHTTLYTPHSTLYTSHCTLHTARSTAHILHFTLYIFTLHPHNFTLFTLYALWNLGRASFSCCARTPTSRPQLRLCTALLLLALPKVHSDAEGGPLNLSRSLVIMLAMLNFLFFFVQQYIIDICSHSRPFQNTSPQYVGLDVHLTNMPRLQTRSPTLTKAAQLRCAHCVFMPSSLPS